ncbi:MAG: hypothetical protein ACPGSD_14315 [Flavobacteriales bacterium]
MKCFISLFLFLIALNGFSQSRNNIKSGFEIELSYPMNTPLEENTSFGNIGLNYNRTNAFNFTYGIKLNASQYHKKTEAIYSTFFFKFKDTPIFYYYDLNIHSTLVQSTLFLRYSIFKSLSLEYGAGASGLISVFRHKERSNYGSDIDRNKTDVVYGFSNYLMLRHKISKRTYAFANYNLSVYKDLNVSQFNLGFGYRW